LCELVDGTLVEKVVGAKESFVGVRMSAFLDRWNEAAGNAGMILGADGTLKLLKKLVRIPDVSFTRWDQLPGRVVPAAPVPEVSPDLVVEVLSEGNTAREMERKLKEYFLAGVRLVWFVDDRTRSVRAYTSPDDSATFGPDDTLDGGDVLPGFAVPVARLFENLPQTPPAKPRKRKKA
jgi:Uma2 family endonuclease